MGTHLTLKICLMCHVQLIWLHMNIGATGPLLLPILGEALASLKDLNLLLTTLPTQVSRPFLNHKRRHNARGSLASLKS